MTTVFGVFAIVVCLLTGCAFGKREVSYRDNVPKMCEQDLKNCFGEEYALSEGVEKEEDFFNEFENISVITYYTEWELAYKDADGEKRKFVFDNRTAGLPVQEHMEKCVENYFCDLVQNYYKRSFWNETVARISGCREDESVLYFQPYQLFSMPEIPETSEMFDERLQYCLTEHIYFPSLRYHKVFSEFPYILDMYLDVAYESEDEKKRMGQCQETERKLREMLDEMIQYTDGSLNAKVHVIMLDENGYADGFSIAVLNGEYFTGGADGLSMEYEKALHENFFGPISID